MVKDNSHHNFESSLSQRYFEIVATTANVI